MILTYALLSLIYFGLLIFIKWGNIRNQQNQRDSKTKTWPDITVVVACKNEEASLRETLPYFQQLQYPDRFSVCFVNDHSSDNTLTYLQQNALPHWIILDLPPEKTGKKAAYDFAFQHVTTPWIQLTDADCQPPQNWLETTMQHHQQADVIAGFSPIIGQSFKAKMSHFEHLCSAAVAAAFCGGNYPFHFTARNLAFRKEIYTGFRYWNASGDDMEIALMAREQKRKAIYIFPHNHTVLTLPVQGKTHFHQQSRRYGKWKFYPIWMQVVGLLLGLFYVDFFLFPFIGNALGFWFAIFLIKSLLEIYIMLPLAQQLQRSSMLGLWPIMAFYYPFHSVFYTVNGWLKKYRWK